MSFDRHTRRSEEATVRPSKLTVQRENDPLSPPPARALSTTPAALGHSPERYTIFPPDRPLEPEAPTVSGLTFTHADMPDHSGSWSNTDFTQPPLVRDPSLLPSNWADRHSNPHQDQAPSPLSVLQRSSLSQDQDDLEHVKPSEQTAVSSEHENPLEANAQTETAEGSSTPPDAEASSAPPEAVSAESAPTEAEASADTGDTAQAGEESVSSEHAAGVAEAQASPEVQVEAQKEGSSEAAPTEGASAQGVSGETSNEPAQEASSESATSKLAEASASNEAAPETAALSESAAEASSETAEASTSSEPEARTAASSEPVEEASSEPAPEAPAPAEDAVPVQASLAAETTPTEQPESFEEDSESPEQALPVQALHLQASASPTASRSSPPDATLATDVRSLSGGQPLAPSLRSELESFHKADLSQVQTFVNPDLTARVQARAFTTGEKIVFNNAGDLENRELLAHETAHVKQQALGEVSGSSVAPGVKLSDPGDAFEREASSLGSSFARQPKQLQTSALESSTATPSSTTVSRDSRALSQTVFSNTASSVQRQPNTSTNTPIQRWGLGDAWDWVKDKASDAWGGLKNLVSKGWDWVKDKASAALVFVLETISKAFGSTGARIVEVLKSVGSAIMGILQNPGAFISNLIAGVKTGFMNFATNAKSHLSGILGQWLTGNSGVQFPAKFEPLETLKSILSTVGASWGNLRGKITGKLGPGGDKALALAEKSVPLVQNLAKGQFHNLEEVKAQVLPAVQAEAVDGLKDGVRDTVLKQGAITLLSRLNPAGGLVTIFKTVQFLIEKASSIASFVSSIWGSLTNIAKGDVGGAAAKVEQSLVSGISLALNFLSKQIGLDGIVKKVQTVVHSISSKVNKVLEFVAGKAVKLVQPILEKIKGGFGAAKTFATNTLEKGKVAGASVVEKGKQFLSGIFGRKSFQAGGEDHSVWVNVANDEPTLMIASTPREASAQIRALRKQVTPKNQAFVEPSLNQAEDAVGDAKAKIKALVNPTSKDGQKKKSEIEARMTSIVVGVSSSVKNVFDQLAANGGNASLLKVQLDSNLVRREFWSSGRPGWAKSTLEDLANRYPDEHESGTKVEPGFDRRHIVAFDHIVDSEVAGINGKLYNDAKTYLRGKGPKFEPKIAALVEVKDGFKKYLAAEFNDKLNLWVGPAWENQLKGREMFAAQQRRAKLDPKADKAEFDKESKEVAKNQVDVPPGARTGRKLTTEERDAIAQISSISRRMRIFEKNADEFQLISKGLKPRSLEYTNADDTRALLNRAITLLRAVTTEGSVKSNGQVQVALQIAIKCEIRLKELLGL